MRKLQEVLKAEETMVGGKALRLAQIQALGLPVKQALVLDSSEVASIVACGQCPNLVAEEASQTLTIKSHGIAVRSSAAGEDGLLSWAGQFKSKLFVTLNTLEAAVLECAMAIQGSSVSSYAQLHNASVVNLALILQDMVKAKVAGVLFTHDPITLNDQVMVIEVVAGVAEGLVSGLIEPRRYYVDAITSQVIKEEGAASPILNQGQIIELVQVGYTLRTAFNCGQDVEWAIEEESNLLFINQSRNITTDGKISATQIVISSVDNALALEGSRLTQLGCNLLPDVLSDQNISEILTRYPHQMSLGLFTYCFAHGEGAIRTARNQMGYDIGEELVTGFFSLVGGQPRCSIIHDAFTYRIQGIPLDDYCQLVNHYLERIQEDSSLGNYPEVQLYEQNPSQEFLAEIFGADKAEGYFAAYQKFFAGIQQLEDTLYAQCRASLVQWDEQLQEVAPTRGMELQILASNFFTVCDLLRTEACPLFVKVARLGFFAFTRLRNLLTEMFGDKGESCLNTLTGGASLEDNPNLQFNVHLHELKQGTRSFDNIVAQYGHLGSHELELSTPRYQDQPNLIHEMAGKLDDTFEHHLVESQDEAKKLEVELLKAAGSNTDQLRREIKMARTYLPLREVVKFHFLKGYAILRQLATSIESTLGWSEGLIFHLNPEEVFKIANNYAHLQLLATQRKAQRELERLIEVPAVVYANKLEVIGQCVNISSNTLKGIGVTNAVTEGDVVVVTELNDTASLSHLHAGSILVTTTTDPAWSPVLAIIGAQGGLITEVGGLLAHGAIYAREMNIAAVLNVPHATKILKTGMKVRVNGPLGIVEVL